MIVARFRTIVVPDGVAFHLAAPNKAATEIVSVDIDTDDVPGSVEAIVQAVRLVLGDPERYTPQPLNPDAPPAPEGKPS